MVSKQVLWSSYGTVAVLEDGLVHLYADSYANDTALERALTHRYLFPW